VLTKIADTLRVLAGVLAPGGVLLAAGWAIVNEPVVRDAAAPYVLHFCFGAMAAAVLLSWYHDQSRLLCIASAALLSVSALVRWPDDRIAILAATVLVPVNFTLFGSLKERGVMTMGGAFKIAVVAAQAFGVATLIGGTGYVVPRLTSPIAYGLAAVVLVTLAIRRRGKVEQGLCWALAAMFLGARQIAIADALFVYAGTAGLILLFAVLEHGYDIAYRDELTGLLGRRAFLMGQLGRTYAIAMCDVDHFKRFNDTYGHEAGDQVLRMVAAKLSQVRGGGRVFRYGGEEFLVVFRGRSAKEAEPFVEAVRKSIADAGFVLRGPGRRATRRWRATDTPDNRAGAINVTISIGVAERSKRHSTSELVLEAADRALYRAKEAGRNRVTLEHNQD
jgi:diguanylate cyclase (GGDEF)-like protein